MLCSFGARGQANSRSETDVWKHVSRPVFLKTDMPSHSTALSPQQALNSGTRPDADRMLNLNGRALWGLPALRFLQRTTRYADDAECCIQHLPINWLHDRPANAAKPEHWTNNRVR